MPKKEKFIIIDGNALLHRAFHALPPMTTSDGTLVNAVYGFTSILLKIIKELKPDYLCASFDRKGTTLRAQEFKEYKAQRKKQPDELYAQIPLIENVLEAFNIPVVDSEKAGYEADDVIGSVVTELKGKNILSTIVTGDLDALQLVDKQTEVFTLRKGISDTITYDPSTVFERYSLKPDQLIDYKALRGDPSDNIPGVRGIGEKTATGLIKAFKTLDKLYEGIDKDDKKLGEFKERIINLLKDNKKEAYLSKKLVTIETNLPTNFKLKDTALNGFDTKKIIKLFSKLEFNSLLTKIPQSMTGQINLAHKQNQMEFAKIETQTKDTKLKYTLIDTDQKFKDFLNKISKVKEFAVDTETTSLNIWQAKLLGISFSWNHDVGYYVVNNKKYLKDLKPILEDPQIKKVGHHLKYDYGILSNYDIYLKGISFDTLLAAYLLTSGSRNLDLDSLVFAECEHKMQSIEELIGPRGKNQLTLDKIPLEEVSWYACEDADFTLKLSTKLKPRMDDIADMGLLKKLEIPLISVLSKMEKQGILVDKTFLKKLDTKFTNELKKIKKKIYKFAGSEFNIASPLQLKEILFEKLNISSAGLKRTKTGISTAAGELEKMKDRHAIIPLISQFREYSKLQNTYTRSLQDDLDKNNRIHTTFNQTITATGRLSSSKPNLQNIPIRTELGREIRKAFIAPPGFELIAADYSQIELRVIASLANDKKMISYFKRGDDIHKRTAANINKKDMKDVTFEERYAAKEINFGIIYGLGARGLAQRTELDHSEAKAYIEAYYKLHPSVKKWLVETKDIASELGYVETLLGRRRYLPDINSGVPMIRASAERMATNAPIQGTAADLLKMAMIEIDKELNDISTKTNMLLTVHDEIVFEVPKKDTKKVTKFIKNKMENIYKLRVPIKVDIHSGKNWGECK
ncbi:DNA polymerase I [bacterium]|jgi:DNA polymerase I|nr:DNA polymerase I [bacterium]MBT4121333.1 DNA polymerase I [bacterium]MBT4335709.1 DNA polymerase I [bacterium]MBT4495718.1 DNA polymerase I [bacterium]MBT4763594.1 DNA polymerase I [bacterium]